MSAGPPRPKIGEGDSLAIETTGLRHCFGAVRAVDGVDLRVPAGEVTAFLGPNGAGKTTTIRLLLGLLRPDAGRIRLFGEEIRPGRWSPLSGIGALIEQPSLYEHLTGAENLEVTGRTLGLPSEQRARRKARCLEQVGLTGAARRPVQEYSLGMKQRLGLALALLGNPRLLILDEPTNGLDPEGIHEMRSLLRRLAAESGVTVLLSSHLLAEVEQTAARVAVLGKGRLLYQGSMAGLRERTRASVVVETDKPEAALRCLVAAGLEATAEGKGRLRVAGGGASLRRRIAALVVEAGIGLETLNEAHPTLEEAFFRVLNPPEGGGES